MKEDRMAKFFLHPYTIIFFLGCFIFMLLSSVTYSIIYPSEPAKGATDATTPEINIWWGILFMACLGLFLFGLWSHAKYKIVKKSKGKLMGNQDKP